MEIKQLREVMGTNPKQKVELKTEFFEGVKGIKVELLDAPLNPYVALFNMATSTWGNKINKWNDTDVEGRFWAIKSVLDMKTLPNAMESISFTFGIERCSRSAFDQIARARIGAVVSSMGWRDNDHSDIGFRVPQNIWDDKSALYEFQQVCLKAKEFYHMLINKGQSSWQDARAVLPISACHNFSMAFNYMALRGFCSNREKFCEQADTVATAWLMREEVKKVYPWLASYLRPGCDWKGVCEYHQSNTMSEAFGCLFKECGRNKCLSKDDYATFNYSCSDKDLIERQLGICIPDIAEQLPPNDLGQLFQTDLNYLSSEFIGCV